MATTTNYGWTTPDDTALVKDGASAIRTLGSSVDTTTKNLNPETTLGDIAYRSSSSNTNTRLPIGSSGQVLTVAAGVPSWATPTDQTPLTTKGDLLGFSTLDARIPIGTNGHILTADSTESLGLKWAAPAGSSPASATASSTGESATNSTSYTDTDPVLSVTLTTGTKALVLFATELFNSGNNRNSVAVAVSGATTIGESDNSALFTVGTNQTRHSMAIMFTSLTAGSNTFTMKMKTQAGTISTQRRQLTVIDLGS